MRLTITALALLASASLLSAQIPTRALGAATAGFPETFTTITGFRVLDDGHAIVADILDGTLQRVSFLSGASLAIGRKGAGPREWANPGELFALPGDSTVMADLGNGRFFLVLPDGRPGPTFRLADEQLGSIGGLIGADPSGRLYLAREVPPANAGRGSASTGVVEVFRHDRRTGRSEKVAQYATVAGEVSAARMLPNGLMQLSTNLPLAPRDITVQVPGGDLAIVRHNPYRVDRLRSDGRMLQGAPAEAPRIRVTQAEKEAFVKGQIRPGQIIVSGGANAGAAETGAGGARAQPRIPTFTGDVDALFTPDMRWPEFKPPFASRAAVAAPSGDVWVMRSRPHDDPNPVYDVFGADGRVKMRVQVAPRSRVVGIGANVVFVARSDEDDLIHLERFALPR